MTIIGLWQLPVTIRVTSVCPRIYEFYSDFNLILNFQIGNQTKIFLQQQFCLPQGESIVDCYALKICNYVV